MSIHLIDIFASSPTDLGLDKITWFENITKNLMGDPALAIQHPYRKPRPALVEWRKLGNCDSEVHHFVVELSFHNLYWHSLFSIPGKYSYPAFHIIGPELLEFRSNLSKRILEGETELLDVSHNVKFYINMIFGQLDSGILRHENGSMAQVVDVAREVMEEIYQHPKAFYADTDTIFFGDARPEEIREWVSSKTSSPFDLIKHSSVEVFRKKQLKKNP